MRKYNKCQIDKIEAVTCNQCGKQLKVENGILREGAFQVDNHWGYFSHKDGETHSVDLCEECYEKWIDGFAVPPTIQEENEMI